MMVVRQKEIMMRTHGHVTVWNTPIGIGRASGRAGWCQQLRNWWTAHKAARRQAKLDALNSRWDATREAVRPLRAEAAIEMALAQGALSIATQPYALAI
jgi:hypothetical protein